MKTLYARNVNEALAAGLQYLQAHGLQEDSRNGSVLVAPEPVCTVYDQPRERVLFSPLRDANPFFHLMEALWMLNGQNDLAWPLYFNSRFGAFSDDGVHLHGAYGHRWRRWFGYDQLAYIVDELRCNRNTRRAVLAMWDSSDTPCYATANERREGDWTMNKRGGKDVPCNTHAYLDCRGGALNMTVCCRSNDILWGAYGANAVHFSVLQEVLAAWVGVSVGVYRQMSNNYHMYTGVVSVSSMGMLALDAANANLYKCNYSVVPLPMVHTSVDIWLEDLQRFMFDPVGCVSLRNPFFERTARPMYLAWKQRKEKRGTGLGLADKIEAADWRRACVDWLQRRELKKQSAAVTQEARPAVKEVQ